MTDDYNITITMEKDVLEWIVENYSKIETVNPRMILKTADLKTSEMERSKGMANIKFGI